MGGKVFTSGNSPLYTPRMALAVYEHVKRQSISALRNLFHRVESPIEAPEKASFGDVDILVSLEGSNFPRGSFTAPSAWAPIQKALRGVRSDYDARAGTHRNRVVDAMSIAIPWPTDLSPDACAAQTLVEAGWPHADVAGDAHNEGAGRAGETDGGGCKERYVQVDVHLCGSDQELDWRLFKHNHGDLWNILGHIIRPFGLTADETSLSIRIPEIEMENRKGARVFLTDSPVETLEFLGLSHQNGEWKRPFQSVDDLFEYAASCKWFMLWPPRGSGTGSEAGEEEKQKATTSDKDTSAHPDRLKHNDRARMKQRPLFARWITDFTPRCHEQRRFLVPDTDGIGTRTRTPTPDDVRAEVRAQAFRSFPGSGPAYAAALAAWRREKSRLHVKTKVIKEDACLPADVSRVLPAPQEGAEAGAADLLERNWRGVLRSALARILIEDDGGFGGVEPPRLRDDEGCLVVEDVKEWIGRNWMEVGRVAWEMQCERARAQMEEKRKLAEAAASAGEKVFSQKEDDNT